MKRHYILTLSALLVLCFNHVFAQMPDQGEYQQNLNSCDVQKQKLAQQLANMAYDKQAALKDLQEGLFCSKCKKSKTEFDRAGQNFYQHIKDVNAEVVAATPAEIEQNQSNFDSQINDLQNQLNSQSSNCDQIQTSYQSQVRQAQQQAQQAAVDRQNAQIQAQQQAYQLAQQQRQAAYQRYLEQQKEKQQQLQQQQNQLNANQSALVNNLNQISAQTEARLQDAQANGRLDDSGSDGIKNAAQNIDQSTNNKDLGQQAFGGGTLADNTNENNQSLTGNNYTDSFVEGISDRVQDQAIDDIAESNSMFGPLFQEYKDSKIQQMSTVYSALQDMGKGDITKNTVDMVFMPLPSSIPNELRKEALHVAIENKNTTIEGLNNVVFNENATDAQRDEFFNKMNPLNFTPPPIKSYGSWTQLDYAKGAAVVVGGAVFIAAGGPVWLAMGTAAWFGFTH